MHDKEKLNKLVDLIEDLLKEEGNEWIIDEILDRIERISPIEKVAKTSIIQRINEYCIEGNIAKQAEDFYKEFKIEEIKSVLIQDFKKMEHEKRRNDFANFSISVYQQVEGIVNYIFNTYLVNSWENLRHEICINSKSYGYIVMGENKFNFPNTDKQKFKAVTSLFYLNESSKSEVPFINLNKTHTYLKDARNTNHRGQVPYENQTQRIDEMSKNQVRFILLFYGFLEEFIKHVNINFEEGRSKIDEMNQKA